MPEPLSVVKHRHLSPVKRAAQTRFRWPESTVKQFELYYDV